MKTLKLILSGLLTGLLLSSCTGSALAQNNQEEKIGVLVIAHGAPMPSWNQTVENYFDTLQQQVMEQNLVDGIKLSYLEFAGPSVADGVYEFESEGYTRLYALPLFVCNSDHSDLDVPAVLGLYTDPDIKALLLEEGAEIVDTQMSITILPTINYGDTFAQIIAQRVSDVSTDPENEAVILYLHGSEMYQPYWDAMCEQAGQYICAATGISYFDFAYIHMGIEFSALGLPAVYQAADQRQRIILASGYVALGTDHLRNGIEQGGGMMIDSQALDDIEIITIENGLIPSQLLVDWAIELISSAVN